MKVTMTRAALYDYLKSMIRVVPKTSAVMELLGFLVECDENDGHVKITGTNLTTTIQRRFKANIDTGGSFVVAAAMFFNIITLLGGEEVTIEQLKRGLINIKSGDCTYTIPVLEAKNYPKVDLPFPDDVLKIKGLSTLYSKTVMAVADEKVRPSLAGIHLELYSDAIRAVGCDLTRMAISNVQCDCGGKMSVTIPKQAFYYLVNAVTDTDELQVGYCGDKIVFMKDGMAFATKYISEAYLDVDRLTAPEVREHVADIKSEDLRRVTETVSTITSVGGNTAPIEMKLTETGICFTIESEIASSSVAVETEVRNLAGNTFYYSPRSICEVAKVLKGGVKLEMSDRGVMYLSNASGLYMLVNCKKGSVRAKKKSAKTNTKVKKAA